ncbi:MAG: hypothetical protein V7K27_20515 [Nostoc sp.]|uniref:hypothetical protein n=1 Tax=Nostoc sp. TaxID=1180 RepID=UPI002FFD4780
MHVVDPHGFNSALDVGWVALRRNPTDYQDVGLRKASTQPTIFLQHSSHEGLLQDYRDFISDLERASPKNN